MLAANQKDPTCKGGFCACTVDQKVQNCSSLQSAPHQQKMIASSPFPPCKLDVNCKINNSACNTILSQCQCNKGYVFSMDKTQCLPVAQSLSFPCTEDKQCLAFQANTTCQQHQCICVTGYHAIDNVCWKMAPYGSACKAYEECNHINGAFCTDRKVCGCKEGTMIDNTQTNCVPIAEKFGDHCRMDKDCSDMIKNSTCIDATCQCKMGSHFVKEVVACIVDRDIDEPCKHDYDCYRLMNSTKANVLKCVGSLCDCSDEYHRNGNDCTSAGARTIGSSLVILSSIFIGIRHFL